MPSRPPVDSFAVQYVYAFDHKHRKPPMTYKDLLGGKGANLAEMTTVLRAPRAARLHRVDRCLPRVHAGGWPAGLDDEIASHVFKLEKAMGRKLGDPHDPLLVSVRSGAKFSMPGMMDTVLNLGLNDESVKGLANVTGDERFAYDSYRRFISMYGRIVLGVDGAPVRAPARGRQAEGRHHNDADLPALGAEAALQDLRGRRQEGDRRAVPAAPEPPAPRSDRGRVLVVERCPRDRVPRAREDQPRPRHRRQRADDGVRQPRRATRAPAWASPATPRPARTCPTATSWSTPRARTWWRASATPKTSTTWPSTSPSSTSRAARHLRSARGALPGHVRHRVHHRAGQALDAPDPCRQAHRRGRPADGGRDDQGHRDDGPAWQVVDQQGGGRQPRHRRAPRLGAAPAVREEGQVDRQGPRRVAGRRGRQARTSPPTRQRQRSRRARTSSSSAARRAPKTSTA